MGINIKDLDGSLQPIGASLLSGNESVMDNLRELTEDEQKISGGGKKGGGPTIVTGGGGGFGTGQTIIAGGGGKKGGGPTIVTGGGGFGGGFPVGVPVPVPIPIYRGFGGFGGFGGGNVTFNVSSSSDSRANS